MAKEFSYEWIMHQLSWLQTKRGLYPFRDSPGAGILLRHDVDFDLVPALALARKESEIGICGTYFFLTSANSYNVLASTSRDIIIEIHSLGFEVGLHFDASIYKGQTVDSLRDFARKEADILEGIVGAPVKSLSLHNPSVVGQYPTIQGFANAYDNSVFSPDRYLSDSRMEFHSCPVDFFDAMVPSVGQLLIHPMHYSEAGHKYPTQMIHFLERFSAEIDQNFSVNSGYRAAAPMGLRAQISVKKNETPGALPGTS